MLNFRSINFILPTGVITLIVLVLGIFITHNINTQHNEITNAAINELKTKSARFSHATTRLLKIDKQFIRDELGYEASNPLLRTAAIIDSNNRIMFSTKFSHHNKNALSIISEFNQTDFKHARDNKTSVITISPGSNIVSILMNYTEPSNSHQIRSLNKGLVYFSYDISSKKNKIITSVFRDLMYEIIGMLFFGIILVITISKYITTPLTEIQNSAKNLAHGEFNLIETNSRLSEISDLTHVFNNMATELDENLKELTHQHQQTKAILDNVIDGIITIDNRGIIQSFNRSAEKISGHTANDIIGKNISLLMTGADKTNHDRYLKSYVDSNKTNVIGILREMEGQKKDGTLFPVDVVITEIKSNKDHLFIGMIRDITERKKVDQMKSEFISTVSHELRTPLTSLNGSIKLLSSGVTGQLNEQGNMLINNAKRNGERLLSLINDLLDMEKILAGKMQFEIERHNLQKIVSDSIEVNREYANQYNVTYELEDYPESIHVMVDAKRIEQVLSNFLSNAAKFSTPASKVDIYYKFSADKQSIRVLVKDSGEGISEEFKTSIFTKFTQADASVSRKHGGTGLGLAISKELIEHMKGNVGFESEEGKGSIFWFELPVQSG